jgi:hypothetical protein
VAAAAAQHDCIAPGRPNLPQDWNEAFASVTQEMTRLFHLMIQDRIVA